MSCFFEVGCVITWWLIPITYDVYKYHTTTLSSGWKLQCVGQTWLDLLGAKTNWRRSDLIDETFQLLFSFPFLSFDFGFPLFRGGAEFSDIMKSTKQATSHNTSKYRGGMYVLSSK
jgi:hypothetical protein